MLSVGYYNQFRLFKQVLFHKAGLILMGKVVHIMSVIRNNLAYSDNTKQRLLYQFFRFLIVIENNEAKNGLKHDIKLVLFRTNHSYQLIF
jgi:hypothetical protein